MPPSFSFGHSKKYVWVFYPFRNPSYLVLPSVSHGPGAYDIPNLSSTRTTNFAKYSNRKFKTEVYDIMFPA